MAATTGRTCYFWDCEDPIPGNHFLCYEHYDEYLDDLLDKCPACGLWKYAEYDLCKDCERELRQPKPQYRREHSKAWEAEDANAEGFYVYILKLEDGSFYAGQTRELRERMLEHRDGRTKTTAGKNPKLVWFRVAESREEAEESEVDLKRLCNENPREIRRWVLRLKDHVDLLDFS